MKSERYLAIIRPVIYELLRAAQTKGMMYDNQTAFHFKSLYGVEGVTREEYVQAVKWLMDALENAQVIVRLDINTNRPSKPAEGDVE